MLQDADTSELTTLDHRAVRLTEKIAVKANGKNFTYTQLLNDARRLAIELPTGNLPVVVLLPRGYALYVSQLAILLQGGFFVPIDVKTPDSRIEFLLKDSQTQTVLTDRKNALRLRAADEKVNVIDAEAVLDSFNSPHSSTARNSQFDSDQTPLASSASYQQAGLDRIDLASLIPHQDDDFIYMIYTSGSTGQPKGVPIHWKAMNNHYRWFIKEYAVSDQDRCMQISSPGFDISIEEIWGSLQIGATLYVVDDEAYESAEYFWQWVTEHKITILDFSTALWQALLPVLADNTMPESVRLAIIGGEAASPADAAIWFSVVDPDKVRLSNCYGPTETVITSTFCDLLPNRPVTIGKPIDNLNCVLVDSTGQKIQQPGQTGEIYISGDSVAQGYWHRPEKTAEAFGNFPACGGQWSYRTGDLAYWDEQGDLVFCGRCDDQVKLRGYRIELGEIETAVREHPQITNCIVKKIDFGTPQLVAFACTDQAPPSGHDQNLANQICSQLASSLPDYMIPNRFSFMEKFPLTSNGKIDHQQLVAQLETCDSTTEIDWDSELKNTIAAAWKTATGHFPDSDSQSFADAGGDSLSAMALITELRRTFTDLKIGVAAIRSQATLNSIAEFIESHSGQLNESPDQPPITRWQSSNLQSSRWLLLFHPAGGGCSMYEPLLTEGILNEFMVAMIESPYLTQPLPTTGSDRATAFDFQSIAANYANAITAASSNWPAATQIVTAGYSFGGLMAYEVGQLLRAKGLPVVNVINIDQPVPSAVQTCGIGQRAIHWLYRLRQPLLAYRDQKRVRRDRLVLEVAQGKIENQLSFSAAELQSMKLEDYYCQIESHHQPKPAELPMHLIRGGIFEAKHKLANDYGWSDIVSSLRVHQAHGTHSTLFLPPNVQQVRRLFATAVEQIA